MATPTIVTLANANQYNQVNAAVAVSNFTTATDVSPGINTGGQAFVVGASQLYPGQMWRFTANGIWSSSGSPGLSLGVYYGGAAGSPLCYGSVGAGSTPANAASVPWMLDALGKVTAVGANATSWQVIGKLCGINSANTVTMMPAYTSVAVYDSASPHIISIAATCGSATASNAVTVYNWAIEYMTEY